MSRPSLQVVGDDGVLPVDAPSYAEVLQRLQDAEDMVVGQEATIKSQAARIGRLERELERINDPDHHPQGKEIVELVERWKAATGHPRAKVSKDRVDVIKARLKDGYSLEQIALAIDGAGAFPYVQNGKRVRSGHPSQRHDRLGICLGGGEALEKFAVMGHEARKRGWVTWDSE